MGQDFDPSLLERKDRAELVAIATSLGEKPPSRAKKADIVALIMRLVGADDAGSSGDGSPDGPSASSDDATDTETDGAAESDDDDASNDADSSDGDDDNDDDDDDDDDDDSDERSRRGAGRTSSGRGNDGGRGRSGRGGSQAQAGNQPRGQGSSDSQTGQNQGGGNQGGGRNRGNQGGGQDSANKGDGGQGNQGGRNQGNQDNANKGDGGQGNQQDGGHQSQDGGNQQGQGDDTEPGNRRRRRRGRDRRPEGEEQPIGDPVDVEGLVDLRDEGYGFLRVSGYLPSTDDAYISVKQARQFGLRKGDRLKGKSRPANRNEKNPALLQIDEINGAAPVTDHATRTNFEDLTPLFPDERLRLEQTEFPENMTARIIDLLAPIGKGQRGLIVSPPKAGKTTVVKQIVRAIERNHPEVEVIVLLVDERPEEVTDLRRWMLRGEVAASTFDRPTEEHVAVAELVLERAKRLVEAGKDVVIVLDGITRLARAYNLAAPGTGRVMAGGIDTGALYPPKKFFGAARNVEEGGSLTILATALVETNTRMDEVIFEEFKGTGNMELRLDRRLAERRIFPAIDVEGSSTRHEELLYDKKQLAQVWKLRRVLGALKDETGSNAAGIEMLVERLKTVRTNEAFLDEIAKS